MLINDDDDDVEADNNKNSGSHWEKGKEGMIKR